MEDDCAPSLASQPGPATPDHPAEAPVRLVRRIRSAFYFPRNAWVLTATSTVWSVGGSMRSPFQPLYFYNLGASVLPFLVAVAPFVASFLVLPRIREPERLES